MPLPRVGTSWQSASSIFASERQHRSGAEMTFWSGATLASRLNALITPYDENYIDCNSYTLHMSRQYFLSFDGDKTARIESLKEHGSVSIPPGQFAFLLTADTL